MTEVGTPKDRNGFPLGGSLGRNLLFGWVASLSVREKLDKSKPVEIHQPDDGYWTDLRVATTGRLSFARLDVHDWDWGQGGTSGSKGAFERGWLAGGREGEKG